MILNLVNKSSCHPELVSGSIIDMDDKEINGNDRNNEYDMDKTTKILISLIGGLGFFLLTKELILSLIICLWLVFAFFSLPYQIFLFFSLFLLLYYLVFKNISFVLPAIMVVLGLILTVLPRIDSGRAPFARMTTEESNKFLSDTKKTMGFLVLLAFFLFALIFSYREYQKQQAEKIIKKEKPVEKVIINLKQ